MKSTTKKLDAALDLLALLKRNIVADVVGEMSKEDQISLRQLCAECGVPAPQMTAAIAQLIKEVEDLISFLITQLEAEIVEIELRITQAQDALRSKPQPGSGPKIKR